MAGKFRGRSKWDPTLIIYQILTVQSLSYASLCLLLLVATGLSGFSPSIMFIFDHRMIGLGLANMIVLAHLANAFVSAYLLMIFVERSRQCLDFSITYYVVHFVCVWYYSRSIPDSFVWYFINIFGACIMCVTSEFLCRREEMRSIPISASV